MTVTQVPGHSLTWTAAGPDGSRSLDRSRHAGRALGGVAAQGSQAAASLVLQLVALRALGLEGLALFGTLYAVLILATAVASGFVGDSLTVLDRGDRSVRAGLQAWGLMIMAGVGLLTGAVLWATGFVDRSVAVIFALTAVVFLAEDLLRRLLMANLRFWRIVLVDVAGLLGAVAVLLGTAWSGRSIGLGTVFLALLGGQLAAIVVAVGCLPKSERYLVRLGAAAIREVAGYGGWRAAQQASRPALQSAVRVLCVAMISLAAVGELEAARIYLAPATVAIAGLSSVLFATYAAERSASMTRLLRRADRSILVLSAGVLLIVLLAIVAVPTLGSLLTGNTFEVSRSLVAGWGLYAIAVAVATPYGALAAARGRQRAVLVIRLAEVVLSLATVAVLLQWSAQIWLVPVALGSLTLVSAMITRVLILRPMARGQGV